MALTNVKVESTQTTRIFLATGEQAISTMFFCNFSETTDCTIDIYAVPAGSPVNTSTQIVKALDLPKTETFVFDLEKLVLSDNDELWAKATVDKIVVATVSSISTS